MRFLIEFVSSRDIPYVIARQLDAGDFRINSNSLLGEARVMPPLSQPRAMKPGSSPDTSLFAFRLQAKSDATRVAVGETVALTTSAQ